MAAMIQPPVPIRATDKAEAEAAHLNAAETEGWTYAVNHQNSDRTLATIAVYDPDGIYVGDL